MNDEHEALIQRVMYATEGVLWVDVDYDELPKAERECPRCGNDTLHVDEGRLSKIHRCSNCRFEGATR